jgi:hypothetical protein
LRAAIALDVREPVSPQPSERLAAFVAAGTAPLGAKTRLTGEYWAAIGGAARSIGREQPRDRDDRTAARHHDRRDVEAAPARRERRARVNDLRRAKGMRPLR